MPTVIHDSQLFMSGRCSRVSVCFVFLLSSSLCNLCASPAITIVVDVATSYLSDWTACAKRTIGSAQAVQPLDCGVISQVQCGPTATQLSLTLTASFNSLKYNSTRRLCYQWEKEHKSGMILTVQVVQRQLYVTMAIHVTRRVTCLYLKLRGITLRKTTWL